MNDLTLLYYSANILPDIPAKNVRQHLQDITGGVYPLISVTQKPVNFGENICVGLIGRTYYNCYKQILTGAWKVKTKYIACTEDDTLYSMEHFSYRPPEGFFGYNGNMWYSEYEMIWRKYEGQHGMCGCIVETKKLIEYLEPRFIKFPEPPDSEKGQRHFQEPGRDDNFFGIPNAQFEIFYTNTPLITFNYFAGLGGKTRTKAHIPIIKTNIEPWGDCDALHNKFWKGVI